MSAEDEQSPEMDPKDEAPAKPAAAKKPAAKKVAAKAPAAKQPTAAKDAGTAKQAAAKKPAAKKPLAAQTVEDDPATTEKAAAAKEPAATQKAASSEKSPAAKEPKVAKASGKATKEPAAEQKPAARRAAKGAEQKPRRRVVRAQARYVRTSARKARMVCGHLRGKSVEEARAILAFTPREVARDWSKLLESAVANAESNHELLEDDLIVREAYADEGPTIKRFRPRAMGRATPIRKRTSHLTITLTPGS
jgi:ribosomal protein L22